MSSETCLLDQRSVREALDQGRAAHEEFAATWDESLDELADLRANLEAWQRELSEEQVQIERVRSIFEDEKRAYYEEIATNQDENAALRDQLDAANAAREQLQMELESAESSADAIAESQSENEELRAHVRMKQTEIESNQRRIVKLQSELENARQDNLDAADQGEQLQTTIQELTDAQNESTIRRQQSDEARAQCEALEAELETVRNRAVELSDTLARERHQMASDRAEWADELKRIRQQAIDQAAAARNATPPPVESDGSGSLPNVTIPTGAPSDIVVGSVLAQFDKIRQQRAHRRIHE